MTTAPQSYTAFTTLPSTSVNCIRFWSDSNANANVNSNNITPSYHVYGEEAEQVAKCIKQPLSYLSTIPHLSITTLQQLNKSIKECLVGLRKRVEVWAVSSSNAETELGCWSCIQQGSISNPQDFASLLETCYELESGNGDVMDVAECCCCALNLQMAANQGEVLMASSVVCDRSRNDDKKFVWCCRELAAVHELPMFLDELMGQWNLTEMVVVDSVSLRNASVMEALERFCTGYAVLLKILPLSLSPPLLSKSNEAVAICRQQIEKYVKNVHSLEEIQKAEIFHLVLLLSDWLQLERRAEESLGQFSVYQNNSQSVMILNANALKSLHVFNYQQGLSPKSSLYGLLNCCVTTQGSRLLGSWLRQPLLNREAIEQRLDCVEWMVENSSIRKEIREIALRGLPDISRILSRLARDKQSLQAIVTLHDATLRIDNLIRIFATAHESSPIISNTFINPLRKLRNDCDKFISLVQNTVDLSALERHEYQIKADFSPDLLQLKQQQDSLYSTINSEFLRAASVLSIEPGKKLKLERNSMYGYFMRLTRADAFKVREAGSSEKFVELATLKNGIYFSTQQMRQASLDWDQLSEEYGKRQVEIVREISRVTLTYSKYFYELNSLFAVMDVLMAFAETASTAPIPYCRPIIYENISGSSSNNSNGSSIDNSVQNTNDNSDANSIKDYANDQLCLIACRHPCLEQIQPSFIPNNIIMNHFNRETLIITGPNMSGKSTYMRQLALTAILAQIGCFVPCTSATLPLFDRILTRVGANDSLSRGISTFMQEMIESNSLLRYATQNSLVIVDELGRGTSTHDGFGLAWSIATELASVTHAFTLFATHFFEMTNLPLYLKNITNVHVSAITNSDNSNEVVFTYVVKDGSCGKSFGIAVGEMCKFPEVVLDIARMKVAQLETV